MLLLIQYSLYKHLQVIIYMIEYQPKVYFIPQIYILGSDRIYTAPTTLSVLLYQVFYRNLFRKPYAIFGKIKFISIPIHFSGLHNIENRPAMTLSDLFSGIMVL